MAPPRDPDEERPGRSPSSGDRDARPPKHRGAQPSKGRSSGGPARGRSAQPSKGRSSGGGEGGRRSAGGGGAAPGRRTGGTGGRGASGAEGGGARRGRGADGKGRPEGRSEGRDGRPRRRGPDDKTSRRAPTDGKRTRRAPSPSGFGPHGPPRVDDRRGTGERPARPRARPAPLRVVGERTPRKDAPRPAPRTVPQAARRRRKSAPADVEAEIRRVGGRRADYFLRQLMAAREDFANDRDQEALRILRPLRNALPDAPSVRELTGLAQYRVGNFRAAAKELEVFVELTDSAEQHPVLMDCYRAQRRWKRVDELWGELGVSSPSPDLVTEGRIVLAGSLAERGRPDEALEVLRRKAKPVARPRDYHLRLWYALADLEERTGNLAAARDLFGRVRRIDPDFADVSARSAHLR